MEASLAPASGGPALGAHLSPGPAVLMEQRGPCSCVCPSAQVPFGSWDGEGTQGVRRLRVSSTYRGVAQGRHLDHAT